MAHDDVRARDRIDISGDDDPEPHISEVHPDARSCLQAPEDDKSGLLEGSFARTAFWSASLSAAVSALRTSFMEYLKKEITTHVKNDSASPRLRNGNWIGIPPLYHHKNRDALPDTSLARQPRFTRSMEVLYPSDPYVLPDDEKLVVEDQTMATKYVGMQMPAYLIPFVPYLEKATDATPASTSRKRSRNMDIHTIRGWLHACEKQHGSRCMDRHHSSHPSTRLMRPRYLIDTENGCLVESSESQRYVALSYVWGGSDESACTIKSNMEGLMIPERLRRGTITIPRTILDAMHLVESLGERYLWVDRYCIVQDDSEAKPSQLASMGDIYAGAFFTIVAAQNLDASEGLYGSRRTMLLEPTATKEGEIWRDLQQPGITGDQIMLDQSIRLMRSKWFSRGWTFQENYFSRRKVIFHDDTVNWECSGASWHETQDMSVLLSQPRGDVDLRPQVATHKSSTSLNGSPWPDMIRYARLVTLFNDRDLKYPQDVFNAFAGCLHQLSSVFPGGFISSLPVMCFDAALLWQPWKPLTRRHSKAAPERDSVLPSWTWAGWAGVLHSESWRSAANYQLTNDEGSQQCSWRTFSTVCWYYSDNLTSKRQMVKVARECAQPDFTMPRKNLVQGWSYASTADGKHPKLVLHSSGPTQPFRYPIPICDPQSSPQPVVSARYLHCVTNRGFLKLGKTISRRSNRSTRCPAVELRSTFSKWAGVLRLSCRHEDVYEIVKRQNRHDRGLVELIEISAGSVKNQDIEEVSFDEWNIASCPRHNGLYEFVNVLWIEWRDGVAYRRALGRVKKSAWSRLDKERISITLG